MKSEKTDNTPVVNTVVKPSIFTETFPPGIRQNRTSKVWFIHKKIAGRSISESLETTLKTIAQTLAARRIEALRESLTAHRNTDPSKATFAMAEIRYREQIEGQVRTGQRDGKTAERKLFYVGTIFNTWQAKHGQDLRTVNPKAITPEAMAQWLEYFCTEAKQGHHAKGQGYSPVTTNCTVGVFRDIWQILVECNPMLVNLAKSLPWIPIPKKKVPLPTDAQWVKVKEFLRSTHHCNRFTNHAIDFIEACEFTGGRMTEIGLIVKDWVHLDVWQIHIPADARKGRIGKKRGLAIPIMKEARPLFQRLYDNADKATGKLFRVHRAYGTLARACRIVGVPPMTHHTLRKFFATRFAEQGYAPAVVGKLLGHKDGGWLANTVYTEIRDQFIADLGDTMTFKKPEAVNIVQLQSVV